MACTPQEMVDAGLCIVQGMSERQMLASIVCQLASNASADCDPEALVDASKCIWASATSDRQLLAMIVWLQCQINGG